MMEMGIEERGVEGRGRGRLFCVYCTRLVVFVSLPCSVHRGILSYHTNDTRLALVFLSLGKAGGKLDYKMLEKFSRYELRRAVYERFSQLVQDIDCARMKGKVEGER